MGFPSPKQGRDSVGKGLSTKDSLDPFAGQSLNDYTQKNVAIAQIQGHDTYSGTARPGTHEFMVGGADTRPIVEEQDATHGDAGIVTVESLGEPRGIITNKTRASTRAGQTLKGLL